MDLTDLRRMQVLYRDAGDAEPQSIERPLQIPLGVVPIVVTAERLDG